MKIIEIHNENDLKQADHSVKTIVLGFFDGVHLGHQFVIANGRKLANERQEKLAVLSFDRHPSALFQSNVPVHYLTNKAQKIEQLERLGVDIFYIVSFTEQFSKLSPQDFVQQYIVNLGVKHVLVGFDYRFGYQAEGNVDTLRTLGKDKFIVSVIDKVELHTEKVSSTAIRQALDTGDIEKANRLLGRPHETMGVVVHGDARGRTIGFPTANIDWEKDQYLPMESVYIVEFFVAGQWYQGMASIGRNITFEKNRQVTVEVNIFNFNADIYGQSVKVRWLKRLRKELKFNHVDSLIRQLQQDKYESLTYFGARNND